MLRSFAAEATATAAAVKQHGADFCIAWDGDFDRCFFFDEKGQFIEGYYLVGLLAQAILAKQPGGKVVHGAPFTSSKIVSKSISKDGGRASYRGLLRVAKGAHHSKSNVV